ncbi:MAG: class I SAM-dependent RNA methyltransferase [Deltaproteobacteria bacterium]|nr:class I SAM-dependent RNA methyltransferase [Deltaproteobacteria bacterium]
MPNFFAVCAPGLEPFTTRELKDLGLQVASSTSSHDSLKGQGDVEEIGGVAFRGSLTDLYRANLHLRTASRVLLHLGSFFADTFSDLKRRAKRLGWESYLNPESPVALRVTCHKSRLFHSAAVTERVMESIGSRLGQVPPPKKFDGEEEGNPPQLIFVRLVENRCTLSLDSSGALLSRRGYRLATTKAPLRETLAAGILMASGWDLKSPLVDPFCGAGTIPIEAAMMARKMPPGLHRHFAFMDWPDFRPKEWESLKAQAQKGQGGSGPGPLIMGSDRDAGAILAARSNAERAGVAESIEFSCLPVSAIEPPAGPGWVVTNPPYGVRLKSSRDLYNLYSRFGEVLRAECSGWHVAFLYNRVELLQATGLQVEKEIPLRNGGIRVKLARGKIPQDPEK